MKSGEEKEGWDGWAGGGCVGWKERKKREICVLSLFSVCLQSKAKRSEAKAKQKRGRGGFNGRWDGETHNQRKHPRSFFPLSLSFAQRCRRVIAYRIDTHRLRHTQKIHVHFFLSFFPPSASPSPSPPLLTTVSMYVWERMSVCLIVTFCCENTSALLVGFLFYIALTSMYMYSSLSFAHDDSS